MTQNSDAEGAKRYYQQEFLSGGSYYLEGGESKGIASWGGRGAGFLSLSGDVKQSDFESLCENRNPENQERLTARHRAGRSVGYDITFNAPKSTTLLYEIGGDDDVLKAFSQSIDETMADIEADALTRVRVNGTNDERKTCNMVWAKFNHFTTRPVKGKVDPHMHAHVFAFNATLDATEEKWKAVQFREINRDMPFYQSSFHNRFAEKLEALGYKTEKHGHFFEVTGVSRHSIELFSNRTAQIESKAKKLGLKTAEAKAKLGATTRAEKGELPGIETLREEWTDRLSETELRAIRNAKKYERNQNQESRSELYWDSPEKSESPVPSQSQNSQKQDSYQGRDDEFKPDENYQWSQAPKALQDSVSETFAELFCRSAVVNERRVQAAIYEKHLGRYSELEVEIALSQRKDIEQKTYKGQSVLYSKEELWREGRITNFVRDGLSQHRPMAKEPDKLKHYSKLSKEQNQALHHVLLSKDSVIAISGKAGTGKTRLTRSAVKELNRSGKPVVMLAPSAEASRGVLRSEGFKKADTVAKFLSDEKFQADAKNGVIWIDEAGLLSNQDIESLFKIAAKKKARVVLSGDTLQHKSVSPGSPLSMLYRHTPLKPVSLTEIRRQKNKTYKGVVIDKTYKEAVELLSVGRTREGIEKFDQAHRVYEGDQQRAHKKIATKYQYLTSKGKSVVLVSPTNVEREELTQAVRAELTKSGKLKGNGRTFATYENLHLTDYEKLQASNYKDNESVKIRFHRNMGSFKAGDIGSVVAVRDNRLGGKHLLVAKRSGVSIKYQKVKLKAEEVSKFSVVREKKMEIKRGEKIRFTSNTNSVSRRFFTKNDYHRVSNGQVAEVQWIMGNRIVLTNGVVIDATKGNFTHGYALTSYGSQGKTADYVFVSQHGDSLGKATSREQVYVSASRGCEGAEFYTSDKELFISRAGECSEEPTPTDVNETEKLKARQSMRDISEGELVATRDFEEEMDMNEEEFVGESG